MARDTGGSYSLPDGNPVVTLTVIASAWANTTMADIGAELTNSLDRNDRGPMLARLRLFGGDSSIPGLAWAAEPSSGLYRVGAGHFQDVIGAISVFGITTAGLQTFDGVSALLPVGYRDIAQVSFSADRTLGLSDAGKHCLHPSADIVARTLTIPANASVAFPLGTAITVVNQSGAGVVSIAITTDTMRFIGTGSTGTRVLAANGLCTLLKITPTEWVVIGTGLT